MAVRRDKNGKRFADRFVLCTNLYSYCSKADWYLTGGCVNKPSHIIFNILFYHFLDLKCKTGPSSNLNLSLKQIIIIEIAPIPKLLLERSLKQGKKEEKLGNHCFISCTEC